LNITVLQVGHLPLMALRPFFIVSSTASTISFLALHLTQYPSGIKDCLAATLHAPRRLLGVAYGLTVLSVNWEKARSQSGRFPGPYLGLDVAERGKEAQPMVWAQRVER
jgi:hypothetical protein